MTFDINAAMASRDQSYSAEPIQRADTEAFQRMDLFGRKRRRAQQYYEMMEEESARQRAALARDPAVQKYNADEAKLNQYIEAMSKDPEYAEIANAMRKMRGEVSFPSDVLGEFRGHINRFENPNDPKYQYKPMTQEQWDKIYNAMNDDGVMDYLRGAGRSTLDPTTMKDGVIDGVQPGYQKPPAFQAAKPAEARLDQPDARDSSS